MFVDVLILKALDTTWEKYDKDGDGELTMKEARDLIYELFTNLHNYVT